MEGHDHVQTQPEPQSPSVESRRQRQAQGQACHRCRQQKVSDNYLLFAVKGQPRGVHEQSPSSQSRTNRAVYLRDSCAARENIQYARGAREPRLPVAIRRRQIENCWRRSESDDRDFALFKDPRALLYRRSRNTKQTTLKMRPT
jgi:hypothetical protein